MSFEEILSVLVAALERTQIPYMVTGSVAGSIHGAPRATRDIDIVIDPTVGRLRAFLHEFPADRYYADELQAVQALGNKSQFNVIDSVSGWKIDFIISKKCSYDRMALSRRLLLEIAGTAMYVASAEDLVIAKLRWAKLAESERQIQDVKGILAVQGEKLDSAYVEQWINELGLAAQWQSACG